MRAAVLLVVALAGCTAAPPLTIVVDKSKLAADGLSRAKVTVQVRDPLVGAVVQFAADGGALTSSAVALPSDGVVSVDLIAPLEKELGRQPVRHVSIVANIAVSKSETLSATTRLAAVPPQSGAPILFVSADPPAAVAGIGGPVDIDILTRRISAGAKLDVTGAPPAVVAADGTARTQIAVPSDPVDQTVTVTDPASGVSSSIVVRFVKQGDPLFDLSGSFVQIGPARVKLVSGALTPNPQCAIAPSIVLAQFTQSNLDIDAHYTTCDVTFPPVTSIVGTVTDKATDSFYAAIPVVHQQFSLDKGDLGAHYAPPPSVVVVGANLSDPQHDALPTDPSDPRVVDADNDGQPGVTVENSLGGDQHIVFRNIGTTKGNVVSSNEILGDEVGDLLATTETSVFGIGGAFLPDTQALGSVVELVRIDGKFGAVNADANGDGTITCAEVLDVAESLDDLEVPDTPFDCGADK